MARLFNRAQKLFLFGQCNARCELCAVSILNSRWHAHHVKPFSLGGETLLNNAAALCVQCHRNIHAGATLRYRKLEQTITGKQPRDWQVKAREVSGNKDRVSWVACPGAGKTFAAGFWLSHFMQDNDFVLIVSPFKNVRKGWRDDLTSEFGIQITDRWKGEAIASDYNGASICYGSINRAILKCVHLMMQAGKRIIVVLDEIHHGSDTNEWGSGVNELWELAYRGLALTGTPFRTDNSRVAGLEYGEDGIVKPTYEYTYKQAIRDEVCRTVAFHTVDGYARWVRDGENKLQEEISKSHEDDWPDITRTIYENGTSHSLQLIKKTIDLVDDIRRTKPNAGALFVCGPSRHLEEKQVSVVANIIHKITGEPPVVVTSDDDKAQQKLQEFKSGSGRFLVAINMVCEGVNIPRLQVACLLRHVQSRMLFNQLFGPGRVGRQTPGMPVEQAEVVMSAMPMHKQYAAEIEETVRQAIAEKQDSVSRTSIRHANHPSSEFTAISSSAEDGELIASGQSVSAEQALKAKHYKRIVDEQVGLGVNYLHVVAMMDVMSVGEQSSLFTTPAEDIEAVEREDRLKLKKLMDRYCYRDGCNYKDAWKGLHHRMGERHNSIDNIIAKRGVSVLKDYIREAEQMLADVSRGVT